MSLLRSRDAQGDLIQPSNGRFIQVMVVAENAYRCRGEHPATRVNGGQSYPSCDQNAQNVAVCKEQYIARLRMHRLNPRDDAICAQAHCVGRLTIRAAVLKQPPIGALGTDGGSGAAFVITGIPFTKIRIQLG